MPPLLPGVSVGGHELIRVECDELLLRLVPILLDDGVEPEHPRRRVALDVPSNIIIIIDRGLIPHRGTESLQHRLASKLDGAVEPVVVRELLPGELDAVHPVGRGREGRCDLRQLLQHGVVFVALPHHRREARGTSSHVLNGLTGYPGIARRQRRRKTGNFVFAHVDESPDLVHGRVEHLAPAPNDVGDIGCASPRDPSGDLVAVIRGRHLQEVGQPGHVGLRGEVLRHPQDCSHGG